MSLEKLPESLPENPEDTVRDAVEEAAFQASALPEFNSALANQQKALSSAGDYETGYLVGKAKEREERSTVGHDEQILVDTEDMKEVAGQSPRVDRSVAASIVEEGGEFELAEAADRAELLSTMKMEYFGRVVDPKSGVIIEQNVLQQGVLLSAMNAKYRGGVSKETVEYNGQVGTSFVDTYGGAEAFYDFVLASGTHPNDRVALQISLIENAKIDTSEKYITQIGNRAGFNKAEMEELVQAFKKEEDDFAPV